MDIDVAHGRDRQYWPAILAQYALRAGRSSRWSPCASLLLDNGDTFLTRIVRTFLQAEVDDVVVVLGHEAEAIAEIFSSANLPARIALNADYDRGQLSSLVAGLNLVDRPGVIAVLVTLVDVPLVSAATVRAVVDHFRRTRAPIVRPTSGTRHGHPLLIDRSVFAELRAADPYLGSFASARAHARATRRSLRSSTGGCCPGDIDTSEEYANAISDLSIGGADGRPRRGFP